MTAHSNDTTHSSLDHHDHAGHWHAGHSHRPAPGPDAVRRYLWSALLLLCAFLLTEVALGIRAGSLALLSDAGHMLTDVASLVLALVAMTLAARPARGHYTFGYKRAEVLSAQINGVTLVLLGAWFLVEGIRRLVDPPAVSGEIVLIVAVLGIGVNAVATWLLSKANRSSLNIEGAFQHMLTDMYAFVGTAVAGVVVITTGFVQADSIAALIVAALMLRSGWFLVSASGRVILEAAPKGVDPRRVQREMSQFAGVLDVHELHIWEVTSGFVSLSAHVIVSDHRDCHQVRHALQRMLSESVGIEHSTLQVQHRDEDEEFGANSGQQCCSTDGETPQAGPGRVSC